MAWTRFPARTVAELTSSALQDLSRQAPPDTAEVQGSLRDPVSGHAHAGTCGHDRQTAASPLRLVRPVVASVVPLRSGWSGLCLQKVERAVSTVRPLQDSVQVSES